MAMSEAKNAVAAEPIVLFLVIPPYKYPTL